jgi:hypothetical protein
MIEGCVSRKNKAKCEVLARRTQTVLTGNLVDFLTTQPKESLEALRRRTINEVAEPCGLPTAEILVFCTFVQII